MTDLTQEEVQALHEALDDEYQAWATYDQVIADFGRSPISATLKDDISMRYLGCSGVSGYASPRTTGRGECRVTPP